MSSNQQNDDQEFRGEYNHIKSDVKRVVITNVPIILLLAGLYFANQKYGFLIYKHFHAPITPCKTSQPLVY